MIRQNSVSLIHLYALPDWMERVKQIEAWLSSASDGLVLGCVSFSASNSNTRQKAMIYTDIELKPVPGNVDMGRICNDLHIDDASIDSTYPTEIYSVFRGKMRAIMIKFILVRRACPQMVIPLVQQFVTYVKELTDSVEATCPAETRRTATLKKVHGIIRRDSYISVPQCVTDS